MNNSHKNNPEKNTGNVYTVATEKQWQSFCQQHPTDTPAQLLQRAIHNDQPRLVLSSLRNTNIDINKPCEPEIQSSLSPLMLALHNNNLHITHILLQQPNLTISQSLPEYDSWRWAQTCSLTILQHFLEHPQTHINAQDGNQRTLLHEVVHNPQAEDKLHFLLQQDTCQIDIEQSDGTTPLYRAALVGNTVAVSLLLQHSANVNNHNHDNQWSVLHVAVANNNKNIVNSLLAQPNININAKDDRHNTALHIASERGFDAINACLLDHPDININSKNLMGWTALHTAAFAGHKTIVKQLLSRAEIQINFVDQNRQTALHWAAQNGQTDTATLLAKHPSTNLYIKNRVAGHTALDIAHALGHILIINCLQKAMNTQQQADELSPDDDYQAPTFESNAPEITGPLTPEVHGKIDDAKP